MIKQGTNLLSKITKSVRYSRVPFVASKNLRMTYNFSTLNRSVGKVNSVTSVPKYKFACKKAFS